MAWYMTSVSSLPGLGFEFLIFQCSRWFCFVVLFMIFFSFFRNFPSACPLLSTWRAELNAAWDGGLGHSQFSEGHSFRSIASCTQLYLQLGGASQSKTFHIQEYKWEQYVCMECLELEHLQFG